MEPPMLTDARPISVSMDRSPRIESCRITNQEKDINRYDRVGEGADSGTGAFPFRPIVQPVGHTDLDGTARRSDTLTIYGLLWPIESARDSAYLRLIPRRAHSPGGLPSGFQPRRLRATSAVHRYFLSFAGKPGIDERFR